MDILKNPIIIALIVSSTIFAYLKFTDSNDKKHKKIKRTDPFIVTGVVFVLAWLIAYAYSEYSETEVSIADESISDSQRLIGAGIQIPDLNKLPNVFLRFEDM